VSFDYSKVVTEFGSLTTYNLVAYHMDRLPHIDRADASLLARDLSQYLPDHNEDYLESLLLSIYTIKTIEETGQKAWLDLCPFGNLQLILFDLCIPVIHIQHLCHILSMVNLIEPVPTIDT